MTDPVRVSILGSTGSVGAATLDVMSTRASGGPEFQAVALTAHSNVAKLAAAARAHNATLAVIGRPELFEELKSALSGSGIEVGAGPAALEEAAARKADIVVSAIVGIAGLRPTLAAIRTGATVALANKESMVCAGRLIRAEAQKSGARLLPIDSEHNAIFQVLDRPERVEKIILTASGGPFRLSTIDQMARATPKAAVNHPNWDMGAKISVDSATMMNKGLELIEAAYLFDIEPNCIDIVIHPQSIIHSLVQYDDGSVLAQMGQPDMRIPISYALAWPKRMAQPSVQRLDLAKVGRLDFEEPDLVRFPALRAARLAAEAGGAAPVVLNGVNEVGVEAFLKGRVAFLDIAKATMDVVSSCIEGNDWCNPGTIDEIELVDSMARERGRQVLCLENV